MPPRFSYWTILAGGLPTAFRATDREELLPTFQRLREKHPDAVLKWFARGRLWESPDEARAELERKRQSSGWSRDRSAGASSARGPGGPSQEKRDRSWRPGGEHRDPRQKFADAKKARNADRRKQRFERKHGGPGQPHDSSRHAKPVEAPRGPRPPHTRDRFEGGNRAEGERRPPAHHGSDRGPGGKAGGPPAGRPRPFASGTRNPEPGTRDRYRDNAKAGGAHADRPRPFAKDRYRDNARPPGGAHGDRPRPSGTWNREQGTKDGYRDNAKAGGAHGDRPRPSGTWNREQGTKDGYRDNAKAGGAHGDRPRPSGTWNREQGTKDGYRDNAKAGGTHGDRPRPSGTWNREPGTKDRFRDNAKSGGAHTDRPQPSGTRNREPGTKDRFRGDAKTGGTRAFERPAFGRNRETPAHDTRPRDTPAPDAPPDKTNEANGPDGHKGKRRFPRS